MEGDRKVLVVDADPQCNATQLTFDDDETEELYEDSKNFHNLQRHSFPSRLEKVTRRVFKTLNRPNLNSTF